MQFPSKEQCLYRIHRNDWQKAKMHIAVEELYFAVPPSANEYWFWVSNWRNITVKI